MNEKKELPVEDSGATPRLTKQSTQNLIIQIVTAAVLTIMAALVVGINQSGNIICVLVATGLCGGISVSYLTYVIIARQRIESMSPSAFEAYVDEIDSKQLGSINPKMICPHCREKGNVRTITRVHDKGIHGGKAMFAILTGGLSLLATGLSRKEVGTQSQCMNCGNTWQF